AERLFLQIGPVVPQGLVGKDDAGHPLGPEPSLAARPAWPAAHGRPAYWLDAPAASLASSRGQSCRSERSARSIAWKLRRRYSERRTRRQRTWRAKGRSSPGSPDRTARISPSTSSTSVTKYGGSCAERASIR